MITLLREKGVLYRIEDKSNHGKPISVQFNGVLRNNQQEAVNVLASNNNGVLSATTAFGKTVTAIGLIARRGVNTLILVHTKALLDQWVKALEQFLTINTLPEENEGKRKRRKPLSPVGTLSSTGNKLHGMIDIALMQSCISDNDVKPFAKEYGMVIADECHHVSAVNFEQILKAVEQAEYAKIVQWQNETGIQVLYPLVEDNEWNLDANDANNWYKAKKGYTPVYLDANGKAKEITLADLEAGMMLEDNYKRDAEGNTIDHEFTGGGSVDTAQFKVRVLYYNYYRYLYGSHPNYIMGTDSQGYDLALRIAGGIKLSLLVAVFVCVINFILGAMYGAVEGYYGGWVDMILERVSDILNNVPFIIVATLFQLHLSSKVGPLPCLLFAYVVTGWIGTAYRVRTQFYRFKNQEYVMAARTLGARDARIIWKHIFPNTLGTLITSVSLSIPATIMSESMLSFLGIVKLGTAESTSLGTLLSDASSIWTNYPHLMIYPALVISLMMICFNLFGNGLRDAFNPALRGVEG